MYHYIRASFENKGQTIRETLKSSLTFHRKEKVSVTFDAVEYFTKLLCSFISYLSKTDISHWKATLLLSNISLSQWADKTKTDVI